MKVLQLIDSLRSGGAERMAVSYSNALARRRVESYLCCTRMEGSLKKKLEPGVGYLFLEKRHTLDYRAFARLRNFVKEHKIQIIQAHSSSFFLASLIKLSVPGTKLIWHDHLGERAMKNKAPGLLKPASYLFDGVIAVNEKLALWAGKNLHCRNVVSIKNFLPESSGTKGDANLKGGATFKIICVANLREEKNHLNLLRAFKLITNDKGDISLHLVGKDHKDNYSKEIHQFIKEQELSGKVYFYGEQENVETLLAQADLAVLSSDYEGLPVSLLEYGKAGLPVVCTRVGEIAQVVKKNGVLVPPDDSAALAEGLIFYLQEDGLRKFHSESFQKEIGKNYSEEAVLPEVIFFLEKATK